MANCNLTQPPESILKYARKELRDEDPRLMNSEIKNLNLVKRIEDPHLGRIIKAYKHGTKGNIIFPLAKTNLDSLLRNPPFQASETLLEGIVWHPFCMQALNIAHVLHKILDYEIQNPTHDDVLYGYHLDLKPTNVLVEEPWKFMIADGKRDKSALGRSLKLFYSTPSLSTSGTIIPNLRFICIQYVDLMWQGMFTTRSFGHEV